MTSRMPENVVIIDWLIANKPWSLIDSALNDTKVVYV